MNKLIIFLLLLTYTLTAQDVASCDYEIGKTIYDDMTYSGSNLQSEVTAWYSLGYTDYYKKYRKERNAEKKEQLRKKAIEYFSNIYIADKEGKISYTIKAIEKLSNMHIDGKEMNELQHVLKNGLALAPKNNILLKNAGAFFLSAGKEVCAIKKYEALAQLIPNNKKNKKFKFGILRTITKLYAGLGENDKAQEFGQQALAIEADPDLDNLLTSLLGSDEEAFAKLKGQWEANQNDMTTLAKAANIAYRMGEIEFGIMAYQKLLESNTDNLIYRKNLIKLAADSEKHPIVIKYGKSLSDQKSLRYVIEAYIAQNQFNQAYGFAAKSKNNYLKGLVFEKTAKAAQDSGIDEYEWRLLYRLSYLEYNSGDAIAKERAKQIKPYMPTKGAAFFKNDRFKPKAKQFSSWINWSNKYNKKVYAPDS